MVANLMVFHIGHEGVPLCIHKGPGRRGKSLTKVKSDLVPIHSLNGEVRLQEVPLRGMPLDLVGIGAASSHG